jgi:bifunctional non-homologous end joining protein LigD
MGSVTPPRSSRSAPPRQATPKSAPVKKDKLETYRRRRDPAVTPEPVPVARTSRGKRSQPPSRPRRFVIQEHHARALHWDFRLERDGVLVSWAIPKGLPVDKKTNHLAVQSESVGRRNL